jgi:hypothetical protein
MIGLGGSTTRVTKAAAKHLLAEGMRWKRTHPKAFEFAKKLIGRLPWLDAGIRTMRARYAGLAVHSSKRHNRRGSKADLQDFPASVRKVYLDLKQAVEDRRS